MNRIENKLTFAGELIENNLKKNNNSFGVEYISGNLLLRATDGTEERINVYCDRLKSTGTKENKQYSNDENPAYKGLETILGYVGKKDNPNSTTIISSNSGNIKLNDYVNKNNEMASILQLSALYMTSNTDKIDINNLAFKFKVYGIIEKIKKEFDSNNNSTGNLILNLLVLTTKGGWKENESAELNSCFPMELLIPKDIANAFDKVGYYEGSFASFSGELVNVKTETKEVEHMAFGDDEVKIVTNFKKYNKVSSGSRPMNLSELEINQTQINALKNARDLYLKQLQNEGYKGSSNSNKKSLSNQANVFANNSESLFGGANPFEGEI